MELLQVRVVALEAERRDALERAETASARVANLEVQVEEQNLASKRNERKMEKLTELSRKLSRENSDLNEVFFFCALILVFSENLITVATYS